jgi:hypothetical protein
MKAPLAIFGGALLIWVAADVLVKHEVRRTVAAAHASIPPAERAAAMARQIQIAYIATIFQLICLLVAVIGPLVYLLVERTRARRDAG